MTEEEAENPTEALDCFFPEPNASEPEAWDRTETSLRFGAALRKRIAGARIEREGNAR